jgi:hypothetical protein
MNSNGISVSSPTVKLVHNINDNPARSTICPFEQTPDRKKPAMPVSSLPL